MVFLKEKKTEHTRMYAQLCSSMNTIFTSVVVYSRTTALIKTITIQRVMNVALVIVKCAEINFTQLYK